VIIDIYTQHFVSVHFLAALGFLVIWTLRRFTRGWIPFLLDLTGLAALATMLVVALYYGIIAPLFDPELAELTMLIILFNTYGAPLLAGLALSILTGRVAGRYLRLIFLRQRA